MKKKVNLGTNFFKKMTIKVEINSFPSVIKTKNVGANFFKI